MWVFWERGNCRVYVYGISKNSLPALNLLRAHSPGVEVLVQNYGHDVTIPLRELRLVPSEVFGLNTSANDNH